MTSGRSEPKAVGIAGTADGAFTGDESPGSTYGSNVSGGQVGSLAMGAQARAITVVHQHGLSYDQAKDLFYLLLEQNFPKLAEQARAEARRRVEEFAATFARLAAAQGVTEELLAGFAEPDTQFLLNKAIHWAARRDSQELRGILAQLIMRRLHSADDEPKQQLLGEAILIAGKLTTGQLHTICLSFLVRDAAWDSGPCTWDSFNSLIKRRFLPFTGARYSNVDIERIEHLGCATTYGGILVLEEACKSHFGALFSTMSLASMTDADVFLAILRRESPVGLQLAKLWRRLRLDSLSLTKLGVVVAATSCEQVLGEEFGLDTWVS